jgi:hypothetical protein
VYSLLSTPPLKMAANLLKGYKRLSSLSILNYIDLIHLQVAGN